jgi:hypothetical protein
MRCLGLILTSFLLAACPGSTPSGTDGGPGSGDAPAADSGLQIQIHTSRSLPTTIDDGDDRIDEIKLLTSSIRAIGDACSASDDRCRRGGVELHWNSESAPEPVDLDQAPPGHYSTVKLQIGQDDNDSVIHIEGACKVDGNMEPCEIESGLVNIPAIVNTNTTLPAGKTATIAVELDTDDLFGGIDWSKVPEEDGVHRVDDTRPEMVGFIARLALAFHADN